MHHSRGDLLLFEAILINIYRTCVCKSNGHSVDSIDLLNVALFSTLRARDSAFYLHNGSSNRFPFNVHLSVLPLRASYVAEHTYVSRSSRESLHSSVNTTGPNIPPRSKQSRPPSSDFRVREKPPHGWRTPQGAPFQVER